MSEAEEKVALALAVWQIEYSTQYVGEKDRHDTIDSPLAKVWQCDQWKVEFRRKDVFEFDFYTGLGHRKALNQFRTGRPYQNPNPPRTIAYAEWEKTNVRPVPPVAACVLYSLLSEAEAINESFHDWASNFGYDTDRISHLRIYEACCEIGLKVRKLFSFTERKNLQDLLEDY